MKWLPTRITIVVTSTDDLCVSFWSRNHFRQFAMTYPGISLSLNITHSILFFNTRYQWHPWIPQIKWFYNKGFFTSRCENALFLQFAIKWLGTCCNLQSHRLFFRSDQPEKFSEGHAHRGSVFNSRNTGPQRVGPGCRDFPGVTQLICASLDGPCVYNKGPVHSGLSPLTKTNKQQTNNCALV